MAKDTHILNPFCKTPILIWSILCVTPTVYSLNLKKTKKSTYLSIELKKMKKGKERKEVTREKKKNEKKNMNPPPPLSLTFSSLTLD